MWQYNRTLSEGKHREPKFKTCEQLSIQNGDVTRLNLNDNQQSHYKIWTNSIG